MFRTVSLSIIRSLALYEYTILISLASSQQTLYDIYLLLCVQCWTPDDGQRNCSKHVEFYSKNKFEIIFIVASCMLIVSLLLLFQLIHTNYYKIVKLSKSSKIIIAAPTCFGLHKPSSGSSQPVLH